MTLTRSTDYDLIRSVITHPAIWDAVSDDFTPPVEEWNPVRSDSVWFVTVHDGDELLGLWMLVWHSQIMIECHTCLLPTCGYGRARAAARQMTAWVFRETPCRRVITCIPRYNRAARKFARAAGMMPVGIEEACYLKHGKYYDIMRFGMSRPMELAACA